MSDKLHGKEHEFVLEKPLFDSKNEQFVRRTIDGQKFIAKKFDPEILPELVHVGEQDKADDEIIAYAAAARVLTHENLISVVGPMSTGPSVLQAKGGTRCEWSMIYEWCSHGSLKQLLDKPPVERTEEGFLPEGFVWHVALSMLRAITWLHSGLRERMILTQGTDTTRRRWYRTDEDWMPILHRNIEPGSIYFQAPQGNESYGMCKLGDFSRCFVSGAASDALTVDSKEVLATLDKSSRVDSQKEVRELWKQVHSSGKAEWKKLPQSRQLYTKGSELYALGEVLYQMMKGKQLPPAHECSLCKCMHVNPDPPGCRCRTCPFQDVYVRSEVEELTKYSAGLRVLVQGLLGQNRNHLARAIRWFKTGWAAYIKWKLQTAEGQAHVDHYDDLVSRKLAAMERMQAERTWDLGSSECAAAQLAAEMETETDIQLLLWP